MQCNAMYVCAKSLNRYARMFSCIYGQRRRMEEGGMHALLAWYSAVAVVVVVHKSKSFINVFCTYVCMHACMLVCTCMIYAFSHARAKKELLRIYRSSFSRENAFSIDSHMFDEEDFCAGYCACLPAKEKMHHMYAYTSMHACMHAHVYTYTRTQHPHRHFRDKEGAMESVRGSPFEVEDVQKDVVERGFFI